MNLLATDKSRLGRLLYVVFAIVVSVLYDVFFWHQEKGLGFLIFVVIFLCSFIAVALLSKQLRNPRALWLSVPIVILSFNIFLYNNILVQHYLPWVVLVLILLMIVLTLLRNPERHTFLFKNIPFLKLLDLFSKFDAMYADVFRWGEAKRGPVYKKIAIALVVAIPLLLIFGFLFAQADAIFLEGVKNIFDIKWNIEITTVWRVVRTIILTLLIGSCLYVLASDAHTLGNRVRQIIKLDPTIVGIVLGLVNALFLVFVVIQIKYLFGSADFVLKSGLTFAQYARSGFFELAWVMALAGLLLTATFRSSSHHGYVKVVTALKLFLIIQIMVIAVSALKRMNMYQAAYGFTTLRLYVEWFIYLSMLGFVALSISLVLRPSFRLFFYAGLIGSVVAFTTVASLDVDRIIARRNVDRFVNEKKELDDKYLLSLSADALPELVRAYAAGGPQMRYMRDMLIARRDTFAEKYNSWREINLGVVQAMNSINSSIK